MLDLGRFPYIKGDKAVTSESVKKATPLALKVNFNNDSKANVSIAKDNATFQIVNNKTGAVADSGTLNDAAGIVALAGKSVELGQITKSLAAAGDYTIIVNVKDANDNVYEAELALKVLNDDKTASSVKVKGVTATGSYAVALPFGSDLTKVVASDVVVTPTDSNATVAAATTANNGTTWTVEITAEDGTKATISIAMTVAAASMDTDLSSTTYIVDNTSGSEAITMPATADVATFKANITAAAGATFEVYLTDGTTVKTGDMVTGDIVKVTPQAGPGTADANVVSYTVTVQN